MSFLAGDVFLMSSYSKRERELVFFKSVVPYRSNRFQRMVFAVYLTI